MSLYPGESPLWSLGEAWRREESGDSSAGYRLLITALHNLSCALSDVWSAVMSGRESPLSFFLGHVKEEA